MKFHESKDVKNVGRYIIIGSVGLYLFGALAGGSTGFIAVLENITATNPVVTVMLGLVLVFFILGVIDHFYPIF